MLLRQLCQKKACRDAAAYAASAAIATTAAAAASAVLLLLLLLLVLLLLLLLIRYNFFRLVRYAYPSGVVASARLCCLSRVPPAVCPSLLESVTTV